ncbi:hypothetical protein BDN72DRAFT_902248 [Pluteus cervinus]|uniref:Uncharacterized protein n=1 Tax=Pluteus cervinus TaxID=181527 RepID=A0ACD3ADK1_9AGAR|nr:hypothetical protein BDN72DRAFT_902248 [Pluteus cervinus]
MLLSAPRPEWLPPPSTIIWITCTELNFNFTEEFVAEPGFVIRTPGGNVTEGAIAQIQRAIETGGDFRICVLGHLGCELLPQNIVASDIAEQAIVHHDAEWKRPIFAHLINQTGVLSRWWVEGISGRPARLSSEQLFEVIPGATFRVAFLALVLIIRLHHRSEIIDSHNMFPVDPVAAPQGPSQ